MLAVLLACALAAGEAPAKGSGSSGGHGGSGHSGSRGGKSGSHHSGGRHHHHFVGSTMFFRGYWAGTAYAMAPTYQPAAPIYYFEKSEEELQSDSTWFYCEREAAYYPSVKKCPVGWVRVAPFSQP